MSKDTDLKKLWVDEHKRKLNDLAAKDNAKLQQTRQHQLQELEEKAKAKNVATDEHSGQSMTKHEVFKKAVDRLIGSGAEAYNNYTSTYLALMSALDKMRASLDQKRTEWLDTFALKAATTGVHYASDTIKALYNKIKQEEPLKLKDIIYEIDMKDDNTLDIPSLERKNDVNLRGEFDDAFKNGVHLWLESEGYVPTNDEKTKFSKEGVLLDKQTFNTLRENTLQTFLEGHYEGVTMTPGNTM
jgi:hypothetical protein